MLHPHLTNAFKDPWKLLKTWKRGGPDSERLSLSDLNSNKSQKKRVEAKRKMEQGEQAYGLTKHLSEEDEERQENLIEAIEKFQNIKGIDTSKLVEQAENCTNPDALRKLEAKVNKIATNEYERELIDSGIFDEIDDSEKMPLRRELKQLKNEFDSKSLYEGDMSKLEILIRLPEMIKSRGEFREKLRRECEKSSFVKAEFFRRIHFLPFKDSKKELLQEILDEIEEVQDAPAPIQYEFTKAQKEVKGAKTTAEIKKPIFETFEKKVKAYKKILYANKQFFGGKKVKTEDGTEIGEAGKEFIDYIEDRPNFADMDDKLKKLPGVINERKIIYEKRDKLLEKMPPESQKRLKPYTDEMRFHTLKAYIPELEGKAESNGVDYLEFTALLEMGEEKGMPLFTGEEIAEKKREFRTSTLKEQEAELFLLKSRDIQRRRQMILDYLSLPKHILRDKLEVFEDADGATRKRMLREGYQQQKREIENPLDFSYLENITLDNIEEIEDRLDTEQGQRKLQEITDRKTSSKAAKVLTNIEALRGRMYDVGLEMQQKDLTTVDVYKKDLAHWMRRSEHVFDEGYNHDNPRDEWQYQEGKGIMERYRAGIIQYSGGQMDDLQVIRREELFQGSNETLEKIRKPRYATGLVVMDETGKDETDLLGTMDETYTEYGRRLNNEVMEAVLAAMGLPPALINLVLNSMRIKKKVARNSVMNEFDNYKMPANNEEEYLNKMAA